MVGVKKLQVTRVITSADLTTQPLRPEVSVLYLSTSLPCELQLLIVSSLLLSVPLNNYLTHSNILEVFLDILSILIDWRLVTTLYIVYLYHIFSFMLVHLEIERDEEYKITISQIKGQVDFWADYQISW